MALPLGISFLFVFGALLSKGLWASFAKMAARYTFNRAPLPFPDFMLIKVVGVNVGIWAFAPVGFYVLDDGWELDGATFAFCSGITNMVGNGLMVLAVTKCGVSVACPVGIGIALVGGTVLTYVVEPKGNLLFICVGIAFVLVAIMLNIVNAPLASEPDTVHPPDEEDPTVSVDDLPIKLAMRENAEVANEVSNEAADRSVVASVLPAPRPGALHTETNKQPSRMPIKLIAYPVVAGLASSFWSPLGAIAGTSSQSPPFVTAVFVGLGYLAAGLTCSALSSVHRIAAGPVIDAASKLQQPQGNIEQHHGGKVVALCLAAGVVWGLGTAMHYAAAAQVGFAIAYGIAQCSPCIAAQAGLWLFGETPRSLRLFAATQSSYLAGVFFLAMASRGA